MLSYSDYFSHIEAKNTYFAGANTPDGFTGDYKHLFSEDGFEKVYIVKGGSGTGKSTLIRRCMDEGEALGGRVTKILCSSDPDSLDGVIIEKGSIRIAVIDGTAPHTNDPEYAGACGEIVNCGDHWNSSMLEERKEEIALLVNKKRTAYSRAYKFLQSLYEITSIQQGLLLYYLDNDKMQGAIDRLCRPLGSGKGKKGEIQRRRTMAISMKGAVRVTSFEEAEHIFSVKDCGFLSPLFFDKLICALQMTGCDICISLSPIYGIGEIYIPEKQISFVPYREGREYEKIINLRRFINKELMGEVKQKSAFTAKCYKAMMEGSLENLREAGNYHFALEKIYKEAMDFKGVDQLSRELSADIRKRLSRE